MTQQAKISVLMCVYNTAEFLDEAICSILNQTFADFEFLILDDGSSDQSWEIIQKYAQQDPRIIALQNEKNQGIAFSRKLLNKRAKGKYLAVMDSDDVSELTRLELEYRFLEKHPEVAVVSGHNLIIDEKGKEIWLRTYENPIDPIILKKSPISQGSSMMRKSAFNAVWGYDERLNYGEDYDLWLRLYAKGFKIHNLDHILYQVRIRSGQTKSSKLKETIKNTIFIQKRAIHTYKINPFLSDRLYIGLEYLLLLLPSWVILWLFKKLTYKKPKLAF